MFGLETRREGGVLAYSTQDVTWNQVALLTVPGGASQSITRPVLIGREVRVAQVFINPPPTDRKAVAHDVSVDSSSGQVDIGGGSEDELILVLMR
ncbi:hypothetical protein [Halorhodospira halophila]|uniref:hypothetical protein n=1 Tax=Halorhodospira halophila TaxID=1053 RepID=UPI0019117DF3|nr:hypothetical protein [Halorhodospira halophila]MBK5942702.1 hypothetical protein [Halorhodospira halophila]